MPEILTPTEQVLITLTQQNPQCCWVLGTAISVQFPQRHTARRKSLGTSFKAELLSVVWSQLAQNPEVQTRETSWSCNFFTWEMKWLNCSRFARNADLFVLKSHPPCWGTASDAKSSLKYPYFPSCYTSHTSTNPGWTLLWPQLYTLWFSASFPSKVFQLKLQNALFFLYLYLYCEMSLQTHGRLCCKC